MCRYYIYNYMLIRVNLRHLYIRDGNFMVIIHSLDETAPTNGFRCQRQIFTSLLIGIKNVS